MGTPKFEETNLAAVIFNRSEIYWDKDYLISKYKDGRYTPNWQKLTYGQIAQEQYHLSTAWKMLGLEHGDKIGILGKNRPRWVTTAVSAVASGITFVPVYPTLTADESAFVLKDSGAKILMAESMEQAEKVISRFDEIGTLQKIYVMDPIENPGDPRIEPYENLLQMSKERVDKESMYRGIRQIDGDDLVAIIYTSGTTGKPKGVMLTHNNFLSQRVVLPVFNLNKDDIFLNHLPFCHSFGLTTDLFASSDVGATLAIAEGLAPDQIRHALTTIRPTVLMSVPRLFEKLYVQVLQVVGQKPKKVQSLFHSALGVGKEVFDLRNEQKPIPFGLGLKYKLAGRIINKVRKQAGLDRVRIAYAGGGPTSRELCYFFQSLGIDIYQGYGLTETSPVATVNIPGKNKMGTVGPAITGVSVRIDDDGEILIKGPNVMAGYYNNPEATKEAVDGEGWFHSGDIGQIDSDGYLTITDRKKELIITSGGKNIAPLPIESAFNTEPYIERVVVIGDGRKYLSALLCPNFEMLYDWAKEHGIQWDTDADLAANASVREMLMDRVLEINQKFARFQQIKKVAFVDHIFSEETGELTPTQKVKRRVVNELYKDDIDALYPPE